MNTYPQKPLGIKNYGHIAHLPKSRMGEGDHKCHEGQSRIATVQVRDKYDEVIVQEKLDGSNVGIARLGDQLFPLTRAGYLAESSKYEQHWRFADWVYENAERFLAVVQDGERLCGEWLMQAHGTRYALPHEPFVAFDLMRGTERAVYDEMLRRIQAGEFVTPTLLHRGGAISIEAVLQKLGASGFHGALDTVEGAVWRVEREELVKRSPKQNPSGERERVVDFIVKYVRPDKQDGIYLPEMSGKEAVWNWRPEQKM